MDPLSPLPNTDYTPKVKSTKKKSASKKLTWELPSGDHEKRRKQKASTLERKRGRKFKQAMAEHPATEGPAPLELDFSVDVSGAQEGSAEGEAQ